MKLSNPEVFFDSSREMLRKSAQMWQKSLRSIGSILPTCPGDKVVLSRTARWNDFLLLACLHYYLSDKYRFLIRIELEARVANFGTEKAIVALTILTSEPSMLIYVSESSLFKNTRHWFGFLGQRIDFQRFQLHRVCRKKPAFTQRQRGYRDHGSKRPAHTWKPDSDISLTEEQNRIEERRLSDRDLLDLIQGGLP